MSGVLPKAAEDSTASFERAAGYWNPFEELLP